MLKGEGVKIEKAVTGKYVITENANLELRGVWLERGGDLMVRWTSKGRHGDNPGNGQSRAQHWAETKHAYCYAKSKCNGIADLVLFQPPCCHHRNADNVVWEL